MTGKLRGPRGRMEKIVDGYIKHCGEVAEEIVNRGYAIAKTKSGIIGVQVWIVKPDAVVPGNFHMVAVNRGVKEEEGEKEEKEEKKVENKEVEKKKEKKKKKEKEKGKEE
ncbi:MAG TPA: 30S ribosomal protein S3, partial [Methanophagales archaeon]|nr:30S ribosomal protein S3 [Methanophagales archaeon]